MLYGQVLGIINALAGYKVSYVLVEWNKLGKHEAEHLTHLMSDCLLKKWTALAMFLFRAVDSSSQ